MQRGPRVLLAKIGLDGHDRGVKVVARALRDAGFEVIYTGLWQTPDAVARAAIEEDVDVVGVSLLSAAHMTLVPLLIDAMARAGDGDRPIVVGGIIPREDESALREQGVAAVLGPEAPLDTVVEAMTAAAAGRARLDQAARDREFGRHHPRGLAETLTLADRNGVVTSLPKVQTPAQRFGVTGAPGVGKSTLIGQVIDALRRRDQRVGVLLVDPSSPVTGGALLGDRVRMRERDDRDVFIRSVASAGSVDALSGAVVPMLDVMDGFGFDVLLIETVGAGQADTAIRDVAGVVVLVLQPGAGDELQLAKAGITEVADVFVVNKADQPGADRLVAAVREMCAGDKPVVKTVASRGDGVDALVDRLLSDPEGVSECSQG